MWFMDVISKTPVQLKIRRLYNHVRPTVTVPFRSFSKHRGPEGCSLHNLEVMELYCCLWARSPFLSWATAIVTSRTGWQLQSAEQVTTGHMRKQRHFTSYCKLDLRALAFISNSHVKKMIFGGLMLIRTIVYMQEPLRLDRLFSETDNW